MKTTYACGTLLLLLVCLSNYASSHIVFHGAIVAIPFDAISACEKDDNRLKKEKVCIVQSGGTYITQKINVKHIAETGKSIKEITLVFN